MNFQKIPRCTTRFLGENPRYRKCIIPSYGNRNTSNTPKSAFVKSRSWSKLSLRDVPLNVTGQACTTRSLSAAMQEWCGISHILWGLLSSSAGIILASPSRSKPSSVSWYKPNSQSSRSNLHSRQGRFFNTVQRLHGLASVGVLPGQGKPAMTVNFHRLVHKIQELRIFNRICFVISRAAISWYL